MQPSRAAALLVVLALSLPPTNAAAQISVQGSTVHEFDATPGAVRLGTIAVTNSSATRQIARIYLTDYLFFADGTARYDQPGSLQRSNAGWVQLGAQELTIPPGATVPVSYTVRVPASDSLVGSFWSVIMVEGAGAPSAATTGRGVGLMTTIRYGVQVVTHLSSGLSRMTIKSGKLGPPTESGSPVLVLEIENTGERATKFDVTTELFDAEGVVRGRSQQSRGLTYPGTSLLHHVELGKLPPGTYRAVVVIDSGTGNLTGAQYTLRL